MLSTTWDGRQWSRLMLGTAQLGQPYGLANRTGQPDYREILAIVAAAVEGGVTAFDTAAAYGTSEEQLGRALQELGIANQVRVVTKVRPLTTGERADPMLAASAIEQSVAESRRRLRVDSLPLVLFHREADAVHLCVLERLAERGWLGRAGVSCDHQPTSAACWIGAGAVSAVQLPASLLDRRHRDAGVFRRASARGIAVFVRSVYLQGLLVMAEDSVPPPLREIIPPRRKFEDIARQGGMTLAELALRYLLSQPEVTAIVVGVETAAQARANLALVGRGPLDSATLAAIDATRPAVPDWLITPSAWPGR